MDFTKYLIPLEPVSEGFSFRNLFRKSKQEESEPQTDIEAIMKEAPKALTIVKRVSSSQFRNASNWEEVQKYVDRQLRPIDLSGLFELDHEDASIRMNLDEACEKIAKSNRLSDQDIRREFRTGISEMVNDIMYDFVKPVIRSASFNSISKIELSSDGGDHEMIFELS